MSAFVTLCLAMTAAAQGGGSTASWEPLRRTISAEVGRNLTATAGEHFVVMHPGCDILRVRRTINLLEDTHRQFADLFPADRVDASSDKPLVWILFTDRARFNGYAMRVDGVDMDWSQAYYSARTNRVAFLDDARAPADSVKTATTDTDASAGSTEVAAADRQADRRASQMTHEAVHQIAFNLGLQRRGVMYPLWASEGLATNFEADDQGRMGPDVANAYRQRRFADSVERGREIDVRRLATMVRVPVQDDRSVDDAYADAWAFYRYLHLHHRPGLRAYYTAAADARPGIRSHADLLAAFEAAFGPIDEIEAGWSRYRAKLAAAAER